MEGRADAEGDHPFVAFALPRGGRGVGFAVDGRAKGRSRVNVGLSLRALLTWVGSGRVG